MPFQDIGPSTCLTPYIKSFWSVKRSFTANNPPFEILPDSYRELIFSFGNQCILVNKKSETILPDCFAVNLLDKPIYIRSDGDIYIVGVRLFPFISLGFLNTYDSIIEVPSMLLDLQSVIKRTINYQPTEQILKQFDDYFSSTPELFDVDNRLLDSYCRIVSKNGVISMSEIAEASFSTNRTIERTFRKIIGQSPKGLARKVRFEFMRNFLWKYPDTNLTTFAYSLNFTDLAHFSNEFRKFSNQSPSNFIDNVRKNKE